MADDYQYDYNYIQLFMITLKYFFICLFISLIFASLGISVGFRKLYVKLLLKIFDVNIYFFDLFS